MTKVLYLILPVAFLVAAVHVYDAWRGPIRAQDAFVDSCGSAIASEGYGIWKSRQACRCVIDTALEQGLQPGEADNADIAPITAACMKKQNMTNRYKPGWKRNAEAAAREEGGWGEKR